MRAIDLADVEAEVARVWVTGEPGALNHAMIRCGPVGSGHQWFAQRFGVGWTGCWIADDERAAHTAVESWMRRRGGVKSWVELMRP